MHVAPPNRGASHLIANEKGSEKDIPFDFRVLGKIAFPNSILNFIYFIEVQISESYAYVLGVSKHHSFFLFGVSMEDYGDQS